MGDALKGAKYEAAAARLNVLQSVLKARSEKDMKIVLDSLEPKEQQLYLAARRYYGQGSKANYCFDQRHIDFSTLVAIALCKGSDDRDVVVPTTIFHDAGRHIAPNGGQMCGPSSFNGRIIHMYFGQDIIAHHMREAGYDPVCIHMAAQMIGVHDWHYIQRMDVGSELEGNEAAVGVFGVDFPVRAMYDRLACIGGSGIRDRTEFKRFHDADLINIPACASFAKDYLRRDKYFDRFVPVEFALLRFGYFGMLDDSLFTGIADSRRAFIEENAKVELVSSHEAGDIVSEILHQRRADVSSGYLDLESSMTEDELMGFLDRSLESELEYVAGLANSRV